MMTAEQKEWLRILPTLAGGPAVGPSDDEDADRADRGDKLTIELEFDGSDGGEPDGDGRERGTTKGLSPLDIPEIIVPVIKDATDPHFAHCTIDNQTDQILLLDAASIGELEHGEWKKKPPGQVAANKKEVFEAKSNTVLGRTLTGVEGTVRYFVGDGGTTWDLHFNNPFIGTNTADATLAGAEKDKFNSDFDAQDGNKGTFTYTLTSAGGGTGPQPSTGAQTSCLVTVVNQTKSTLFLRDQDNASGDFMTNPASTLAPGASTQFAFVQTPGSEEAELRGTLSWEVDDPATATWDLEWDNPTGQKNTTKATIKPEGGFHSLDQIGQGDENVPVTFTLSGGGGTDPVVTKGTSCEITITNSTQAALSLTSRKATSGSFASEPPATIAAGAAATVKYAGDPDKPEAGCVGVLDYAVGDDAAASWTLEWNNPPGEANACNDAVDPANAGFQSQSSIGPGDEAVPVTFTLTGGDVPPPEAEFAPPPKTKQPTLRKGDESPDGWVEYAQERLNDFGAGLQVNGKFDGKMDAAVRKFQKDKKCQVDGVIGNETWSALRIGPREAVGTDGREPHTFEQTDAEARFYYEVNDCVYYFKSNDMLGMTVINTGEQPIEDGTVVVKVTRPDGVAKTVAVKVGKNVSPSPTGQGNLHTVQIPGFSKVFGYASPDQVEGSDVDTYLDGNLGGDRWTGKLRAGD